MASFGNWLLSGIVWLVIAIAVGVSGGWLRHGGGGGVVTPIGWLLQILGFGCGGLFLWQIVRTSWYQMRGAWLATNHPEELVALQRGYDAAAQQIPLTDSNQGREGPLLQERVKALQTIKERVETLRGIDHRFAGRILVAAAEIMEKVVGFPGLDFRIERMTADRLLLAYKWILAQLAFTFFARDTEGRQSVAALVPRLTDDDQAEARQLWGEFEQCLKLESEGDIRSLTAEVVSYRILRLFEGKEEAAGILVLCFVGPWDAMYHDLMSDFSGAAEAAP